MQEKIAVSEYFLYSPLLIIKDFYIAEALRIAINIDTVIHLPLFELKNNL